jgi:hypothetical protein
MSAADPHLAAARRIPQGVVDEIPDQDADLDFLQVAAAAHLRRLASFQPRKVE